MLKKRWGILTLAISLLGMPGCHFREPQVLLEGNMTAEEPPQNEVAEEARSEKYDSPDKMPDSKDDFREDFTAEETIWVDICGEIQKPGVYEMPAGARLYQLVEKAGGFTENAVPMSVNQARVLQDGEQIRILDTAGYEKAGAEETAFPEEGDTGQSGKKVDLNHATEKELMTLKGIGAAKAAAIAAYRQEHGAFSGIEEITKVEGIGDGTFAQIKDNITVS